MNPLAKLPLRVLLTLPYVGLVLVLAAIVGLLSLRAGQDAVDTWSEQLLVETVKRIEQAVDRHVAGSAAVLEAAFPRGVAAPADIDAEMAALRTRFWLATSVHREPNNYAYYGDRQGHFFGLWRHDEQAAELRLRRDGHGPRSIHRFSGIAGDLGAPEVEKRIFDPRERPWFKAGESNALHTWTSIYIDFRTEALVATRARRVLDAQGAFAGVVATDLSLQQVNDFLRRLTLSPNGVALVTEPGGLMIGVSRGAHMRASPDGQAQRLNAADSGDAFVAATYGAVSAMLAVSPDGEARAADFTLPDGQVVQVGFSRLRDDAGLDWQVMVAVPRDDFVQGVQAGFRRSLWLGIGAAGVVTLLGLWILATITHELRRVADAAGRLGEGALDTPLQSPRRDELGQLARSFDAMRSRLLTDPLTGLANRTALQRRIEQRLQRHRRHDDGGPFALLFIDFNRFKAINDRHGHDVGDAVLCEMADRLRGAVRAQDLVARYAGDEFVVLLDGIGGRVDAEAARLHLDRLLREPLQSLPPGRGDEDPPEGAAIGLAVCPDDGRDADQLVRHADADMYRQKPADDR
ncbi:MAG: diguanylate cyclase [Burkholderiaceae bacterium]|nr:diguanylate cyclase [Burkholderiaceae bacterium]